EVAGRTLSDADKCRLRDRLDTPKEAGLFFNPRTTTAAEQRLIRAYAAAHGLRCMTQDEFAKNVLAEAIKNKTSDSERAELHADDKRPQALIIGHNLPFDLGALARRFGIPRAKNPMENPGINWSKGFWLQWCSCGVDGAHGESKHAIEHNDCRWHPF